jgi:hypothetical protein
MRRFVKPARLAGISCLVLLWTTASGHAVPVDERELELWVPAFSLVVGLNAQTVEGHVGTTPVLGPPVSEGAPPTLNLQPLGQGTPATERDRMMTPYAGAGIELMTPAWKSLPTRPRAFGRVEVAVAFGPQYNIPNVGDLGPIRPSDAGGPQTESTILGQGARTRAEVMPLTVMAGAGIALTMEVADRALRIKPSVEYLREEVEVSGVVQRVVRPLGINPQFPDYRQVVLAASQKFVYHGVGAGLEAELDTGRAGPFVITLYGGARSWAFVDNEKRNVSVANEFGEAASFTYLKNKWAFGGALGLRFRWVPE